jgi:excinuclease UvrABC ATPase subunit
MDLADGQCEVCSGEGIVELTEEFLDQNPDCCMGDDLEDDEDLPLDEEPGEAEK